MHGGHGGGMTRAWDGMGGHVGRHWKRIKDAWGGTRRCMGGMGGHERGMVGAWESMKGAWVGMREA